MIMPTFDFIPKKKYEYINDGTYTGILDDIYFSPDCRNCWFTIKVDSIENGYFNCMFSNMDIVLNNFCCEYVDDNNCFCSDNVLGKKIEFSVSQRKYGNKSFSKITAIKFISDKE